MTEPTMTWRDRQERIKARGAEYRAGMMTESLFSAYLFSMRERGEDIRHKLNEFAPPAPPLTFEDMRLESSRGWIRSHTLSIIEIRNRELEAAIGRFIECGVTFDRMHIIDNRSFSTTTLYVDDIARFQWKLKGPNYDRRQA